MTRFNNGDHVRLLHDVTDLFSETLPGGTTGSVWRITAIGQVRITLDDNVPKGYKALWNVSPSDLEKIA
jgi:hypothetical protein